jgi:hypothetical protein
LALVIDDANIYWINVGIGGNPRTEVKSVLKGGGGFATQYSGPITKTSPLWLDRGSLYFATPDGVGTVSVTGGASHVVAG